MGIKSVLDQGDQHSREAFSAKLHGVNKAQMSKLRPLWSRLAEEAAHVYPQLQAVHKAMSGRGDKQSCGSQQEGEIVSFLGKGNGSWRCPLVADR